MRPRVTFARATKALGGLLTTGGFFMKLKTLVASIALSLTGVSAMAACTSTTAGLGSLGNSFNGAGTYTDCYTFSLSGSGNSLSGSLSGYTSFLSTLGIDVTAVSLYLGSTLLGSDTSTSDFSFGNLGGGGYTLAISSTVTAPLLSLGVGTASYGGSATIAAPVPEPGAVALTIAGILGVGGFAWRRKTA